MGRTAGRMPALEQMTLAAPICCMRNAMFWVDFLGKGIQGPYYKAEGMQRERVIWVVGGWRPEDMAEKVWRGGGVRS